MSKQEIINKNYKRYSPTKGNRYQSVKKNCVFIHNSNSVKHELGKCIGAIMVHRWGDVKFDLIINKLIDDLANEIELKFKDWKDDHTPFITEAWKSTDRRVDLVNLRTGDEIEFETDKKEKKDDAVTIYV